MDKHKINIVDTPEFFSIKIDGQSIPNITEYSLVRDKATCQIKLTLELLDANCKVCLEKSESDYKGVRTNE